MNLRLHHDNIKIMLLNWNGKEYVKMGEISGRKLNRSILTRTEHGKT